MQIKAANRENFTAKQRKLSDIAYLVVHYTGNRGDTAKNNADYFAREVTGTSAHYFVDEREVWQSVQDNHAAWHCGTKGTYYHPACRNANSIGVEVCMLDKHGKLRQGSVDRAAPDKMIKRFASMCEQAYNRITAKEETRASTSGRR